ncbi:hypothetical protein OUZ56_013068 [Daphnia magna]|uniref:Uncharacterized protein n=1 Tax=Daphnia magna TaxID=35525 RepID=A0ABQ9Z4T6_9CRUS|nr:hypothetical protein OUZ56_013068 [Daphnia magna]
MTMAPELASDDLARLCQITHDASKEDLPADLASMYTLSAEDYTYIQKLENQRREQHENKHIANRLCGYAQQRMP